MNLLTIEHAAIVLNTDPYIVMRLMCKKLVKSTQFGDLYRVNDVKADRWDEYKVLAKAEEALIS